jgi:cell wall-associated NlpC family hydrolase
MPLRVNPIVLLGLIIVSVLTTGVLASALSGGGGTASDALGAAESQLGKPFVMSTDGPDTFSCVGLMRYALRTAGVDPDAPWVPEEYLSRYAPVAPGDLQPGDIVIYPGWATMYAGNGQLINANEMEGFVTHTPMDVAGEPLGIVRPPYGGQLAQQLIPSSTDPVPVTDPPPTQF